MAPHEMKQYRGKVVTVRADEHYGFVGKATISFEDGSDHDLGKSVEDVFLHQDECGSELRAGMIVTFDVVPDRRRGANHLRAAGAVKVVESDVLPEDDPVITTLARPKADGTSALASPIPEHPWRSRMKEVPPEDVAKVAENAPLHGLRTDEQRVINADDPRVVQALEAFLAYAFPQMAGLELGYDVVGVDEQAFDQRVASALAGLRDLGMEEQAQRVEGEIKRFRGTRVILNHLHSSRLLRPNTFIPIERLPELFMACPVWYFAMPEQDSVAADAARDRVEVRDPHNHPNTVAVCDLFPGNVRWAHTFQMFNRRTRPLTRYTGDIMPVPIIRLIKEARERFDLVVVATPYHDVAGSDWENLAWIRSIDPYVLGFQWGCPCFFVLGRFSDAGVFPLLHELTADTIAFLRAHREKLRGFNAANNPYWYSGMRRGADDDGTAQSLNLSGYSRLGDVLVAHTDELLRAFDAGHLYDWLRGEWNIPAELAAGTDANPAATNA